MIAEPGATDKSRARAEILKDRKKALPVRTRKALGNLTSEMNLRNYGFGAAVAGAGLGAGLGAAAAVFTG